MEQRRAAQFGAVRASDGDAVRTYRQVAEEMWKRHRDRLSPIRVEQILKRAQAKVRRALDAEVNR